MAPFHTKNRVGKSFDGLTVKRDVLIESISFENPTLAKCRA